MARKKANLSGYTRIRIKTTIDAEILRSDSFGIDVETGPFSPIKIRKRRDRLSVGRPWCWFVFGIFFRLSRARVKIAMPGLQELTISDNSSVNVTGFDSPDEFKLALSETSSFSGDMKTGNARMDISGGSKVQFNGSSGNLFLKLRDESSVAGNINVAGSAEIDMSGRSEAVLTGSAGNTTATINHGSTADLSGFQTHDVSIKMYRLSRCMIKLDGRLDAMLNGASDLRYFGTPAMGNTSVSTGSILRQE